MSADEQDRGTHRQFLTVEEAAHMLSVSRLRIREAVARGELTGRTDNTGRLRVDLPEGPVKLTEGMPPPDAVVDYLFDEIDELYDALAARDQNLDAMKRVIERQDQTLDRALALLKKRDAEVGTLSSLLARTLDSAERLAEQGGDAAAVEPLLARAIEAAERMEAKLAEREAQLAHREEALERVLNLAERGLSAMEPGSKTTLWQRLIGKRPPKS
ncbi:MAG: hypothetical protein AAFR68_02155 [Pseudomonadota bacterium]